ncbi:MAG: HEAT repeat domain-containing protein [Planctomycetes bacterium]|nr:HEAT repeat domain-containing protein [Planctomycetota bacterium]
MLAARCTPFVSLLGSLTAAPQTPPYVAEASDEAQQQIARFTLAPGLRCELAAAEPDLCNAVAFAFDGRGAVYVAETFRIQDGVFDTRDHMQWKDEDLACLTVADRLAKYQRHIADRIPRLATIAERVRRLVDTDGDGVYDRATVFADGFRDLADGIGSGVLPVDGDVFFTNIPKLWRLRDRDGDGIADEREVVHDGYGVHTSLIGHDLHGLIVGPDRRLWFSIGDRGFHVEHGGRTLAFPHEGAVLRCELDGSDLEVVHRGLRNPQELAFDAFGDLLTGDNNSDGGDRARLVQVVPFADSGWRIGYQWLADRGAWNRERMWQPRHPDQPAWILPPIANFADGPSGLAYDPGQGLPARWRDHFFLCDFRGGSGYSGVHALQLARRGAGFELRNHERVVWGVLATDVDFAPDGSLCVLDWVDGWTKTGKGRIYRLRFDGAAPADQRATAALLAEDLRRRPPAELLALLAHADRRVRQAAQFALVDLDARDELRAAARGTLPAAATPLARLHGIWGLGVLGRRDPTALDGVAELLDCGSADVRAMAARVLGDARLAAAVAPLAQALLDGSARVQREAALALARIGAAAAPATPRLFELLRRNDDHDEVLRHAAVSALVTAAPRDALLAHADDGSRAVRLGVLLALGRRRDAAIATFLAAADPALRFEAARAIHGEPIVDALPDLARLCYDDTPDREATDWRAIAANRMLGQVENGESLVHVAMLANHPAATRIEALRVLAEWPAPHGQDRVHGNWQPCPREGADKPVALLTANAGVLLADPAIAAVTAETLGRLRAVGAAPALAALVAAADRDAESRLAALEALAACEAPELDAALAAVTADAPVVLRRRAVELLARAEPERAVPLLATILQNGTLAERQAAFAALGTLQHTAADALLASELERLLRGDLPPSLHLDLLEAAARRDDPTVRELLAGHRATLATAGELGPFLVCRDGGDAPRGRKLFREHAAANCLRCHALDGDGGNAGPTLDHVGSRLSREQLIEALVAPSARIAEGFGATTLQLTDGSLLVGRITGEQDGQVTLVDVGGTTHAVTADRIKGRAAESRSAMPPMAGTLSRRELRDLVEFLAQRK